MTGIASQAATYHSHSISSNRRSSFQRLPGVPNRLLGPHPPGHGRQQDPHHPRALADQARVYQGSVGAGVVAGSSSSLGGEVW